MVNVVGYKYIQRARLAKSQRLALLIATGVFKNKPPLYYVRMSQGFILPINVIMKLEHMLKDSFSKNFRLSFHNISSVANSYVGKLNQKSQNQLADFFKSQQ